jgi:hypothetical protein
MAAYSLAVQHEREGILGVYEDILKQSCGHTHRNLREKGRTLHSLNPALEFLLEGGFIRQEITAGLDEFQDAQRFFSVPNMAWKLFRR